MVIFLSDGECSIRDETIYDFCRAAVGLGLVYLPLLGITLNWEQETGLLPFRQFWSE